jgi:phospholipid-binding lipoprotein MlaA
MLQAKNYILSHALAIALLFTNCALATENNEYKSYNYDIDRRCSDLDDPFEKFNRKVFVFNSVLDHFILKPVAKGYIALSNEYFRNRVDNFIDNINMPLTVTSNILQLDIHNTLKSFWQFVVNTTIGVGGAYDAAASFDLTTEPQTFGSMLARYGARPGPYIVLPFFGGMNMRDVLDAPLMDNNMNPLKHALHRDFKLALTAATVLNKRAILMPFTDYVAKNSPDAYISIRTALHQVREKALRYPAGYRCRTIDY